MDQKKQKKKVFGKKKHYANRMGRHIKKNKKHGRRPLRTPIPYYFATQTPSYIDPNQGSSNLLPVIPPILNPTPSLPLEPLSSPPLAPQPALSPTPIQDPLLFTTTSTLAYDYIYTSTPTPSPSLAYDYTYTSTLAYDHTYTSTPEYTPTPTPTPTPVILPEPVPESAPEPVPVVASESEPVSAPVVASESEPVSAPQVDGDAIQLTPSETSQEDTIPEDTSQQEWEQEQEQQTIVSDQSDETGDDYPEYVVIDSSNEEDVPTVSAAAAIARGSNNSQLNNGTLASPNQTMQIAGPIIGIAGVMALVAAAMFLVVKRRRKRRLVQSDSHNREPHQHHQEKERGNDDEAYYFEIPNNFSHTPSETPGAPPTQIPSLAPTSNSYPKNNREQQQQQQQQQKEENNDDQSNDENRFSHGTGTLVGSQLTSRTNSIKEQKLKHMSVSSWYSAASSLLSLDTPPPSSGTLVKNNVMLAERQQLQHERPSILDHWKKPIFIETYRAQLADLNDINESN